MAENYSSFLSFLQRYWAVLDLVMIVTGLVIYIVASHSLHQRRHPSAAMAWVLGMIIFPYLTLPLYLAFGSRKLPVSRQAGEVPLPCPPLSSSVWHTTAARSQQLAIAMGLPEAALYENLTIHQDGTQALEALRRVIDSARQTLDVSTFILGRDVLGDGVSERLQKCARDGVKVRLLIDGIGFYMGGYPDLKRLTDAGVEVVRFVPPFRSPKRGRTNLRNHRKMVIADGQNFWCGGRNLAAEYFEGDPRPLLRLHKGVWIDLSFDLSGPLVEDAQQQFEQDWAFTTENSTQKMACSTVTITDCRSLAQLVTSGPDIQDDTIFTLLVSGCFTSQRRILAVTPYFLPNAALLTALCLAARRGIAVELVLPEKSNHRLVDYARHRGLRDLVAAGGKVWRYPGMIHAKAIVIDDELALVGSANLDGRSLFLNYEMMVAFYDEQAVRGFAQWIDARRNESLPYHAVAPSIFRELSEGLILWLAFQL